MQLSFDKASELHTLTITMKIDELRSVQGVMLVATNRAGGMISSAGVVVRGLDEAELLPILLAEVATGWLYGGAREAVTLPTQAFRSRRKSLREARDRQDREELRKAH